MGTTTVDEMVQEIRDADRPLTAADIAERVGVTQQAISKRRDQLDGEDRLEHFKIGRSKVYSIAEQEQGDDDADVDPEPEAEVEPAPAQPRRPTENPELVLSVTLSFLVGFIAVVGFAFGPMAAGLFVAVAVLTAPVAYYGIAPVIIQFLGDDADAAPAEVTDDA